MAKTAIIIGAGPAGLTAAYELLQRTDIIPIILEKDGEIGGISRTINYKGNRMDMGPHRFFSKSDRVMQWWLKMMPLEEGSTPGTISYQNKSREMPEPQAGHSGTPHNPDNVMIVIKRLTRIYFLRKFFAYPIRLSLDTLRTLGPITTLQIILSFLYSKFFPRKPEKSLEDFIINKFGRKLYLLFFKDYTEKVWGVPCREISAEWGAQRIKGLSLSKAVFEAVKSLKTKQKNKGDIGQKETETSLIEQFLYPKRGPGSLWEETARQIQEMGGRIFLNQDVQKIDPLNGVIVSVTTVNSETGQTGAWEGDYFFSTMPVQELIAGLGKQAPEPVQTVAEGLQYRDFINVGILLNRLSASGGRPGIRERLELKDNWIYIQERDVKVGRLMIYNNWGMGMIKDPNTTWIGMEYFCNKTDNFWALNDEAIQAIAIAELEKMDLACVEDVLDITVRRMEKTYPAYFGTYDRFEEIRKYTDTLENLFLIGRNGMHKYNNADHSMLTAMVAVDNICTGVTSKANLWSINTEQEYHEEKQGVAVAASKIKQAPAFERGIPLPVFIRAKENRPYLWVGAIAILSLFAGFKYLYPFANFMPDSYSYISAAILNVDISQWPIGYSKFLRIFSSFIHSDMALIFFQYLFAEMSCLYFLLTIKYFFSPSNTAFNILFAIIIFNPLFLYLSNYISADSLFTGISFIWAAQLLHMIYKPTPKLILGHSIVLFCAFMLRYNALYYPLISTVVIFIAKAPIKYKFAGTALSALLICVFVWHTGNKYKDLSGTRQFTAFGGWQLANNALYMAAHIDGLAREKMPEKYKSLQDLTVFHFDSLHKAKSQLADDIGIYYLWLAGSPLKKYQEAKFKGDSTTSRFKKWAALSPLYSSFAVYLIEHHPVSYLRHFALPNLENYFMPPLEFLGTYNMGEKKINPVASNWFGYKSDVIKCVSPNLGQKTLSFVPVFSLVSNGLFLISLLVFLLSKKDLVFRRKYLPALLLITFILAINVGFSILSAPIVLRYQIFPLLLCFSFAVLNIGLPESTEKQYPNALK